MKAPIGIFDSGIGGLSLLPAISELLPQENLIYLADQAFAPYGQKTESSILKRTQQICDQLEEMHCKLIVAACNTVTTQVIDQLRTKFTLPFVGIEPAIKPAAQQSKNKIIGVLATQGTLQSALYKQSASRYASACKIVEKPGTGLVDHIEQGDLQSRDLCRLVEQSLRPMIDEEIDTLILGCTHYPLIRSLIEEFLPEEIQIIDNSHSVAKQVQRKLVEQCLETTTTESGQITYYSTARHHHMDVFVNQSIDYLPL